MALLADEPHALYRFYGAGGTLLYIGITNSIPTRLKKHNAEKAWWTGVAQVRIEHYPNRTAVLEAERRAIIAEKPLYNVQHNNAGRWPAPPASAHDLVAVCMGCKEQIHGADSGALYVQQVEVIDYAARWYQKRDQQQYDLHELLAMPGYVPWQVHCDFCNPHWEYEDGVSVCDGCYAISTSEVRSWQQLTFWTAHLARKAWMRHTNWFELIAAVAAGSPDAAFVKAEG